MSYNERKQIAVGYLATLYKSLRYFTVIIVILIFLEEVSKQCKFSLS